MTLEEYLCDIGDREMSIALSYVAASRATLPSSCMVEVDELVPGPDGKMVASGRRVFPTFERFLKIGAGADVSNTAKQNKKKMALLAERAKYCRALELNAKRTIDAHADLYEACRPQEATRNKHARSPSAVSPAQGGPRKAPSTATASSSRCELFPSPSTEHGDGMELDECADCDIDACEAAFADEGLCQSRLPPPGVLLADLVNTIASELCACHERCCSLCDLDAELRNRTSFCDEIVISRDMYRDWLDEDSFLVTGDGGVHVI